MSNVDPHLLHPPGPLVAADLVTADPIATLEYQGGCCGYCPSCDVSSNSLHCLT